MKSPETLIEIEYLEFNTLTPVDHVVEVVRPNNCVMPSFEGYDLTNAAGAIGHLIEVKKYFIVCIESMQLDN